jgi:epidermal growth factor receptor substrate 15
LAVLGEIWNLSDSENTGFLNQFGFCIAMRLIAHAQNGEQIVSTTANFAAPLAKFGTIQVNNTGSGVLKNHLQSGSGANSPQPRIASSNSISSFNSHSSNASASNLIVPLLSSIQAANFGAMFDKTAIDGVLPGDQAKNIFLKARLPISILEQIWNLVDQQASGQLTRPQFIVAMHLIQCFMNKSLSVLPTVLSEQLWKVAQSASPAIPSPRTQTQQQSPQQQLPSQPASSPPPAASSPTTNLNTWVMSNQQKKQYGAIFDTLDIEHQSFITSSAVANFLMTSKLPNQILANIWELANLDQSDNFTKQEFSIAMYLVQKKLAGYELPEETPIELIQSSALTAQQLPQQTEYQSAQPLQSFDAAKDRAAPQRTPSHMDDLLGIFQTVPPVATRPPAPIPESTQQQNETISPPAPTSRLSNSFTNATFIPSSSFGKELQNTQQLDTKEEESSDDDEGPENLDLPRIRGAPPAIPGRSNKPHFDSNENTSATLTTVPVSVAVQPTSNYDAIKSVANEPSMFSNQPAQAASIGFTNTSAAAVGAVAGAALGIAGAATNAALGGFSNSANNFNDSKINDDITQASVDVANYSNQVNSLSKQTAIISGKKDRAQNDLNRILKAKDDILTKLNQLKALNEKESQQVLEVQDLMIKSKEENDSLQKDLSIVEANYHAQQTKKDQLQVEYDDSQKNNQLLKEKLGTLNAESNDLNATIEELESKLKQSNNLLAVTQQQVATQESTNEELRAKVNEINNSIFQTESKHKLLLQKIGELNDENMELHEKHTDLSIESANKNVDYSQAFATAASKGLIGDELDELTTADEEVPTASLDDFDEENFNNKKAIKVSESSVTTTNTDSSMSKQLSDTTTPTQLEEAQENSTGQAFSLPFNNTHSETSSTQNNPSQSVRGDLDASSTSTIEDSGPLSSQILPEGTIAEANDKVEGLIKNESFEFVNHPNEGKSVSSAALDSMTGVTPVTTIYDHATTSHPSEEVETLSDTPKQKVDVSPELEEFPPIQELEPLDDDSSSSDEEFQDASFANEQKEKSDEPVENFTATKEQSETVNTGDTTTNNPFAQQNFDDLTPAVSTDVGPSMFDNLGLETAQVEHEDASFDPATSDAGFNNIGFSFTNNTDGLTAATETITTDGDDWEQVFAGFGNDPNLQPATVEEDPVNTSYDSNFAQPAVFGFSAATPANPVSGVDISKDVAKANEAVHSTFSEAQQLAIEELSDMGFSKEEAVGALQQFAWRVDDASNYLLDEA